MAKYTTFDSLKGSTSKHGSVLYGSVAKSGVLAADGVQGIANFRSGATIAVDEATVKALGKIDILPAQSDQFRGAQA